MTTARNKKLKIDTTPYPERLARLLEKDLPHISKIGGASELLAQLGCAGLCWDFKKKWYTDPATPTPPENESLVTETLLRLLRLYGEKADFIDDSDFSILDGLRKENRWRRCLENMDDAHALAALMLSVLSRLYPGKGSENYEAAVIDLMQPAITKLTSDWIGVTYESLPDMERLTKDIFGSAWYDIVVVSDDTLLRDIPEAVRTLRPPFLEGLLPERLTLPCLELPEIRP